MENYPEEYKDVILFSQTGRSLGTISRDEGLLSFCYFVYIYEDVHDAPRKFWVQSLEEARALFPEAVKAIEWK